MTVCLDTASSPTPHHPASLLDYSLSCRPARTGPHPPARRDHFIATCAVLCGADNWVQIADYAHSKLDWLKTFLTLPGGIPSHDTFRRVFC